MLQLQLAECVTAKSPGQQQCRKTGGIKVYRRIVIFFCSFFRLADRARARAISSRVKVPDDWSRIFARDYNEGISGKEETRARARTRTLDSV